MIRNVYTKILLPFTMLLALVMGVSGVKAQFSIAAGATNYTQDFNTLTSGTWADNTTLTGWYAKTDATASITSYAANTGGTTSAGLYAFGIAGTNPLSDRALGYQSSNAFTGGSAVGKNYMGWRLKNNTGSTITSISVTWTGEQWRRENVTANSLALFYQTGTTVTNLTAGTWTTASSSFASPQNSAAGGPLDGNAPANRVANIAANITVSIAAGDEIMLRWEDLNDAGNDHMLAIDDITINATIAAGVTATLANITQPTGTIQQGASFEILAGFKITPTASVDFTAITITGAGTATGSDLVNVRIIRDLDGNGGINGLDYQVSGPSTQPYSASIVFSGISSETGLAVATNYLIVADVFGVGISTAGRTVTVSSNTFTTTATTNTGSFSGNSRTIAAPPGTSTITAGAGTEPASISSLLNTQGASVLNFDFTVTDDGGTPSTDGIATQISQLVLNAGLGNTVTNWNTAIQGVELSDGTNSTTTATIGTSSITFTGISNNIGELGYIGDDAAKTYTLKIWLKTSMGALATTIDDKVFEFRIQNADVSYSGSQIAAGQDVSSGSSNNKVDVTATALGFATQPVTTNINTAMANVTVSVNDANGNRDLNSSVSVDITSSGTLTGSPVTAVAASGLATFAGLTHTAGGTALTLNAERTASLDWDVLSNPFDIVTPTLAADYFRSKAAGPAAWNIAGSWESSTDGSTNWHTATLAPNENSTLITIQSGHTINISTAVTLDQTVVDGALVLQTNGTLTTSNGTGDDLNISNGGVLQVTTTATYAASVFMLAGSDINVSTGGKIQIGAGAGAGGGMNGFATASATSVVWNNGSIFDWNTTAVFGASGVTFFPNVAANVIPVFRVSTAPGGTPGGTNPTIINGKMEINSSFNWVGAGAKTFRNGITGTGSTTQSTFGQFIINGTTAELGGAGTITLGTNGLSIASGATTMSSNKTINGGTISVADSLLMGTFQLNGSSAVTVGATGTLEVGSVDAGGAITGNIPTGVVTLNAGSIVEFNGAAAQFAAARTFSNLIINNSNGVTLNGNVAVTTALTLTNGNITLGVNNLTAGTISAGSVTSHIVTDGSGGLTIKSVSTPTTFPVGNSAASYTPATIDNSTGTADDFSVNVAAGTPCNANAVASVNRVWTITEAIAGGSVADITLQWNGADQNPSFTPGLCAVVHCSAGVVDQNGTNGAASGADPYTQVITGVSSFSPFGVTSDIAVLPVTVEYFRGTKQGSNHLLDWKVSCTNTPSATLTVERSNTGRNFSNLYSINATALRCQQPFSYVDAAPLGNINYYRLKMTDADGKVNYSTTIALLNRNSGFDIIGMLPNPVNAGGAAILNVTSAQKGKLQLVVTDIVGKKVMQQTETMLAGSNQVVMNFTKLAAGTYQVTGYSEDGTAKTVRFVKQ